MDRKSQIAQFTYDALNRLTQVTHADASTTTYTYDAGNRLTQVDDSVSGTITYGYDNLDRLTSETTPQGSVSYTWDAGGRCTSMTVAGQPTVNYTYDNGSRLTQISQGSSIVAIAYDNGGRRTSLTLPNGIVTEYGYDAASQLTSLIYRQGGNVIGDLTYEYDANGRRTRMGGSFARSVSPQSLSSASYNGANQQLTFGLQTLSYDLNGNLTGDGLNTYTWDARDRLASISGPGVSASFQYDSAGRRINKTINGTTTSFLYDEANVVQEQSAQVGNANILNGDLDEILARTDTTGIWGPLADGLGSSLSLTDSSGSSQTEYSYSAFGATAITGAASNNSSQYTGRENDGTGLYYYRARYYSPTLKRFVSQDPIGLSGGPNLYAYVQNRVPNFKDPFGKDLLGVTGGGTAGAALGAAGVMGTGSYYMGYNFNCKCEGQVSYGGAGSVGIAAGHEYGYPADQHESAGLGAALGAGGGLFYSNAPSYSALQGQFQTTIISTPFGVGFEIDTSGDIFIASVTYGKGFGAGIFHFTTNTPKWTTWDTKCGRRPTILV